MEIEPSSASASHKDPSWPDEAALAAYRAWLQGVPSRAAVDRYVPDRHAAGASARSVIGRIKRQLVVFATSRAQADMAAVLVASSPFDRKLAKAAAAAIETLRGMPSPQPLIGDAVERWLPVRLVGVLRAAGIRTLADLTLRVPRRRRWWAGIEGLGPAGARHIEAFFAQHPALTERARALVTVAQAQELVPWERLAVAARVGSDPACLPQEGRTADPVGNRRARAGLVVADHRGRHCLPCISASSEPSRALGRRAAAEVVAGVASLRG